MIMDYLSPFHGSWILKILLWYMLASFVKNQGSAPCSNPPTLDNGSHNGSSVTYPNGAALIYICSNGYIRKSDYPITQCEDGVWSDMEIMCQPRSCYKPADLANGRWDDRNGSYLYATRAFAICNTGYVVGGDWTNMLCEVPQSGIPTWNHATDPPTCARVTCPSTSDPAHGNVFAIGNTYEATADYSCDAGYRLKGTEHQTCLSNKSWSGDPAWCEEIVCPSPALLYLGFTDYSGDPDHIVENDFIFFRCDIHTTRYPDSIRSSRCQGNGAWSAPTPTCAAKCEVPTVQNGNTNLAVGAIVENGTSLLLTACVAGYQITGSQQSRCDNGSWTSTLACEAIPCTAPSDGTVHTFESISGSVTGGKYASGSKGTFVCTGGYEPTAGENATYTCSHGVWQPSIPNKGICTPKSCPVPSSASSLLGSDDVVPSGITIYASCNDVWLPNLCSYGNWSSEFPICLADRDLLVSFTTIQLSSTTIQLSSTTIQLSSTTFQLSSTTIQLSSTTMLPALTTKVTTDSGDGPAPIIAWYWWLVIATASVALIIIGGIGINKACNKNIQKFMRVPKVSSDETLKDLQRVSPKPGPPSSTTTHAV